MKRIIAIATILMLGLAPQVFAQTAVTGNIATDTTWDSDILLDGPVFVLDGVTLTIESGVNVYGKKESTGALIVATGGKLNINGTEDAPVIFTSDQPSPARGDWGGLIINGKAPLNVEGGVAQGEGDTGEFGGNDPMDNSGTMKYFRVEYAGIEFSPENELNGIALQAVGSGTKLNHFQVHGNLDDGIEMFGGTVNWKYGILSECADDSVDWTYGWNGSVQFVVVQQKGDDADNGFEADNLKADNDATPRSAPKIYNATVIGDPSTTYGDESDLGMLMRRGTGGDIRNSIFMGFKEYGLDIDNEATFTQAQEGGLVIDNCIFHNNLEGTGSDDTDEEGYTIPFTSDDFLTSVMTNNLEGDPKLGLPYDLTAPDFRPASGSPAIDGTVSVASAPSGNSFIKDTTYIGAVDPDDDWTRQPWTRYGLASWTEEEEPTCTDSDGDGYYAEADCDGEQDCDDTDATVNPGATEVCGDSKDNDCDGQVDEGCDTPPTTCALTAVLGAGNADLETLRALRDNVMAENAEGALYTKLYYALSAEAVDILEQNPAIKASAAEAIAAAMPTIDAAVAGQDAKLSSDAAQAIAGVLDAIAAKGGIALKIAAFKAKMDLAQGNLPF